MVARPLNARPGHWIIRSIKLAQNKWIIALCVRAIPLGYARRKKEKQDLERHDYILKPASRRELLDAVARLLDTVR
jgi:hypothetical protein